MKQYLKFSLLTIALAISFSAFAMEQEGTAAPVTKIGDFNILSLEDSANLSESKVDTKSDAIESVNVLSKVNVQEMLKSISTTIADHKAVVAVGVAVAVITVAVLARPAANLLASLAGWTKKKTRKQLI